VYSAPVNRSNPTAVRCRRCRLHTGLCLCADISPIDTATRVVIVAHKSELRKSTNTGRIAALCLANSEVVAHGERARPAAQWRCGSGSQPLFLFPHPTASPLADFAGSSLPITLVVPDGTWRQASKMRHRVPGLYELPCASLPPGAPSAYRLRGVLHAGGLATMEAIARALGLLEGPHVEQALVRIFRMMVERTLWSRGRIAETEVTGGIPAGARARGTLPAC
jgi:tRNA-uridine aminocarboxypropyltransferase